MPIFLLIYYTVPEKYGNLILFLGSLFFYAYGEHRFFWLILVSLVIHYALTRYSQGKSRKCQRICLVVMLAYGFGMLFIFKYMDFFVANWNHLAVWLADRGSSVKLPHVNAPEISLPLGISFYTFQIAAYAIDVYRGQVKPEERFVDLGAFLSMFPQLIAGPIVLYHDVSAQLKKRVLSWRHMENGIKTFIIGLSLKMLLANTFGILWNQVQTAGVSAASVPMVWLGALGYTFQIYFDFQGYSMMAMGLGEMLGFRIPRNFRHPYMATSVTDFWRRWHMTLGSWFRDYVYIPLGGSRCSKGKMIRNLLVVWLLTGMWHGAGWNFLLWGFLLFVLVTVEKLCLLKVFRRVPILGHVYMILAIPLSWLIFAISDPRQIWIYVQRLFPFLAAAGRFSWFAGDYLKYGKMYLITLLAGMILITPLPRKLYERYKGSMWSALVLILIFWFSVYCIWIGQDDPFMYFAF